MRGLGPRLCATYSRPTLCSQSFYPVACVVLFWFPKLGPKLLPFEDLPVAPKRIAVIGGGISGMGAAHALSRDHHVTLFEAEPRLGGHARTVLAGRSGEQPVDTGFIVYNDINYPNLVRLFDELDVPTVDSDMSFGVSIKGGQLE